MDDFDFDEDVFDEADDKSVAVDDTAQRAEQDFKRQVKKKIKQLRSAKNPAQRTEAIYWLGESGEPEAIPFLVNSYRRDKSKSVRDAAKYALGMFKALSEALNGTEEEQNRAYTLLEKIILKGEMGSRTKLSPAALVRVAIGLGLSLLVLVFVNLIILPLVKTPLNPVPVATKEEPTQVAMVVVNTPYPLDDIFVEIRTRAEQIRSDGSQLQLQLMGIPRGDDLNCELAFANPTPYELPPEVAAGYPGIVDLVGKVNAARIDLVTAKAVFDQGCQEDAPALTEADITTPLQTITNLLRNLSSLNMEADSVATQAAANPNTSTNPNPDSNPDAQPVTTEPQVTVAPTDTPTETPTIEPTGTLSPSEVNPHLYAMEDVLTKMDNLRGPVRLLEQYWMDVTTTGNTGGCRPPYANETIPANIAPLAEEDIILQNYPEVGNAITQINIGLDLTRNGWTIFIQACNENNLVAETTRGLQFTQTAITAFGEASNLIAAVRQRMP